MEFWEVSEAEVDIDSAGQRLSEAEEVSSCTLEFGLWFSGAEMSSCTLEFWWGTAAESINVVSQRSTSVYKRGEEVSSCTLCLAGASRVHSWALVLWSHCLFL
ncbi:hypothetical protein F2Q68_00025621 [Brassica cretica]|uniref:Uncharacterized protein n=1 Tax=Brassica cretica TaxID=69181 RepID=A0A8S9IFZ1_BRACR|nr:hypothetical protein F2Q68_00025621 [Brassica cretica]